MAWENGHRILDLYEVTENLSKGQGGFGEVYKVWHPSWNVELAVKVPHDWVIQKADGVENFEKEAEIWVNLGLHPHIVTCYYVRRIEGIPAIFAEYIAGGSLHDWIYSRKLYTEDGISPLQRLLDIAIQSAWGLHYAHEQGLVHQDIKPKNVMLTPEGVVKITDFGIATSGTISKMLDPTGEQSRGAKKHTLMVPGSGPMTREYCSPEQADGEILTRRSDMWSWALLVLEMFQGGCTWWHGCAAPDVLKDYLMVQAENPQLPQIPMQVVKLLRLCFRKDPDNRFRTMLNVADELKNIYQQIEGSAYPRLEPKAVKAVPDSLNNQALSLLDLGKQEEALLLWGQALQVQPHHPESTYNKGLVLWRRTKPAIDFHKVLLDYQEICPNILTDEVISWTLEELSRAPWQDSFQVLHACTEFRLPKEAPDLFRHPEIVKFFHYREFPNVTDVDLITSLKEVPPSNLESWYLDWLISLVHLERNDCKTSVEFLNKHKGTIEVQETLEEALEQLPYSNKLLHVFSGHWNIITSIDCSKDGRLALSGSQDATIKLWEIAEKRCLYTLRGHRKRITSVCISSNNQFIASASEDKTVKLWQHKTGRCLYTFKVLEDGRGDSNRAVVALYFVNSICFSPNSRYILSYSYDGSSSEVQLHEVLSRRCLQKFQFCFMIRLLNIDNQPALLIKQTHCSEFHALELLNAISGERLCDFTAPGRSWDVYYGQYISSNDRFIFSIKQTYETDLHLELFDANTDSYLRILNSINTEEEKNYFWLGSETNTQFFLKGSELREGNTERCLFTFGSYENGIMFKNCQLAIFASGNNLHLWQIGYFINSYTSPYQLSRVHATGNLLDIQQRYERQLREAQFALDQGNYIEAAQLIRQIRSKPNYNHNEEALRIWSQLYVHLPRKLFIKSWDSQLFGGQLDWNSVCLSTDNQYALISRGDFAYLSGLSKSDKSFRLDGFFGKGSVLSRDGRFVLSWHEGRYDDEWSGLRLWDVSSRQHIRTFSLPGHRPISGCLSADNRFALSGSEDCVKLWNITTGQCLQTYRAFGNAVCLSTDGRFAVFGGSNIIQLWDITENCRFRTFIGHQSPVNSVCLSLDSRFVLSGSGRTYGVSTPKNYENNIKLWDVASGQCLKTFDGHENAVVSVSLSGDNRFAVSGSYDGTVKLWDISTGKCLYTFLSGSFIASACLSQDSQYILAAGLGVKLWVLDWELEDREPADWDEGARLYLENFLSLHMPYATNLPTDRNPTKKEIKFSLTQCGRPSWTEKDFQTLLYTLGCAGYGWLKPEGVRQKLEAMAEGWDNSQSSIRKIISENELLANYYSIRQQFKSQLIKIIQIETYLINPSFLISICEFDLTSIPTFLYTCAWCAIVENFGTYFSIPILLVHMFLVFLLGKNKYYYESGKILSIINKRFYYFVIINGILPAFYMLYLAFNFSGYSWFFLWLLIANLMIMFLVWREK